MTVASRVAGLLRDAAISAVFGTSPAADAFFVAFRIPNLLRRVVAEGATSAAFVPVFTEIQSSGGREAAIRAAGAVGGAALLMLALLTAAGMAASGPLTAAFAPGFARDPGLAALAASLTFWTFPYLLLVGIAAWAMGVHHTLRRFALPAVGPVLMNAAIIVSAVAVAPRLASPVYALAGGVLAGGALQAAVQLPSLWRAGLRASMFAHLRHPAVSRCGRLVGAALVGGSVYQVNVLIATVFASLLPAGTVSWLWYSDRVLEFPLGVVAVAVGTAALPSLSAQASARELDGMGDTVVHAVALTIAFCLPAAVGLLLLGDDITRLLFERGSFTARDTAMTAWALKASVPGLVGVGLVRVLSAAFFAMENVRVPVFTGLATMALSALLALALMGPADPASTWSGAALLVSLQSVIGVADLRHAGLSLATGISATANAVILLLVLRRLLPRMNLARLARSVSSHAAAALAMAAVVTLWKTQAGGWVFRGAGAVNVIGAVTLGSATYLAAAVLFGSREIGDSLREAGLRLPRR